MPLRTSTVLPGLARVGFTSARPVTATPVRSYRTISSLAGQRQFTCDRLRLRRCRFCGTFPAGFPRSALPTTLPYGVRTFLEDFTSSPEDQPPRLLGLRKLILALKRFSEERRFWGKFGRGRKPDHHAGRGHEAPRGRCRWSPTSAQRDSGQAGAGGGQPAHREKRRETRPCLAAELRSGRPERGDEEQSDTDPERNQEGHRPRAVSEPPAGSPARASRAPWRRTRSSRSTAHRADPW